MLSDGSQYDGWRIPGAGPLPALRPFAPDDYERRLVSVCNHQFDVTTCMEQPG